VKSPAYHDHPLHRILLNPSHATISHYRDQLAAFRAAGVDLPILSPPIGFGGARKFIRTFCR
jgi:hypothetical protein